MVGYISVCILLTLFLNWVGAMMPTYYSVAAIHFLASAGPAGNSLTLIVLGGGGLFYTTAL